MEDLEIGVPSDRVLGLPVAAALSPLPDNCCEACCGSSKDLTQSARNWIWRGSVVVALTVLMLGSVADALASNVGVWQWSAYFDDKTLQTQGQGLLPHYYLTRCMDSGTPPSSVQVSFWFIVCAAFLTVCSVTASLYVGRGCKLCCVVCRLCDLPWQTNSAMVFSIILGFFSLPLFVWSAFWSPLPCLLSYYLRSFLLAVNMDMMQCMACISSTVVECSAGFQLNYQITGISSAASACASLSIILAGFYALNVPMAIKQAVRSKSLHLDAIQGSIGLNSYIHSRTLTAAPNIVSFLRDAALEAASEAASNASRSTLITPQASPFITRQPSPWMAPRSAPSPGNRVSSPDVVSIGSPAWQARSPSLTSGQTQVRPGYPSPMFTVTARSPGSEAESYTQVPPPMNLGGRVSSPIMTATPVFASGDSTVERRLSMSLITSSSPLLSNSTSTAPYRDPTTQETRTITTSMRSIVVGAAGRFTVLESLAEVRTPPPTPLGREGLDDDLLDLVHQSRWPVEGGQEASGQWDLGDA